MGRFSSILGVKTSAPNPAQLDPWPCVLSTALELYGYDLYAILKFLYDEGGVVARLKDNRSGQPYLQFQAGKFLPHEWEEIKRELLAPFRDEIIAVLAKVMEKEKPEKGARDVTIDDQGFTQLSI